MNDYCHIETHDEGVQKLLDMRTSHVLDPERCDSVELDDEIRIQIGKNSASDACKKLENSLCSWNLTCDICHPRQTCLEECERFSWSGCLYQCQAAVYHIVSCSQVGLQHNPTCFYSEAFGKSNILHYSGQTQVEMEDKETFSSLSESILAKQNISTDMLKQQIVSLEKQRQELLAVNNQWDQQFRRMKQHYEKKVSEVKAKLEKMQTNIRELEKERHQMQQECQRLEAQAKDKLLQEMRDKKSLKEENRLLKQETALTNTKKMHYECEISRLNKVVQDALKNQNASFRVPYVDGLNRDCSQEEMRMEMEVLRQQVQIYEEDFKRERSDRERLNEEKEKLQKMNERSQLQLNKLNSQIKDCQEEKKLLEKQVKKQAKDLRALTEKHNEPQQMFMSSCLPCGNCGLLHPYSEPQIMLATCGINRKQPPPPDYQWYVPDRFPPDVQHKANVYGDR